MGTSMRKAMDRSQLEARRLHGARLLQRGVTAAEVARRLAVSRTSVWRGAQQRRMIVALKAGAQAQGYASDLWTLARIARLIETISGQRYSESGVWRLLKRLNFSRQRPVGRALQRAEEAIRRGKEERWPALKCISSDLT